MDPSLGAFVRIVSLSHAATEIVLALGLADELVGVSDASPDVAELAGVRVVSLTPRPPAWRSIQAVRRGQVSALDAAASFDNAGPRAIDGIRRLAELFDPAGFVDVAPPGGWAAGE